jgi:hypothetical protein
MAHWTLSFDQPLPWDDLTLALGALANAFTGQQHPWQQQLHQTLEDRDYANACFRRELTRPDATLSALQESGDGNPRDGYGYQQRLTLTLHDPPLSFQAHNSGWEPSWRELHLSFQSNRTQDLQIARDALRAALDPQRDRTMTAHTAHTNIEQARDLDPQTARAWLAEALTHGPSGQALQRLLALDAQLNGNDPDKLARRLRETPQGRRRLARPTRRHTHRRPPGPRTPRRATPRLRMAPLRRRPRAAPWPQQPHPRGRARPLGRTTPLQHTLRPQRPRAPRRLDRRPPPSPRHRRHAPRPQHRHTHPLLLGRTPHPAPHPPLAAPHHLRAHPPPRLRRLHRRPTRLPIPRPQRPLTPRPRTLDPLPPHRPLRRATTPRPHPRRPRPPPPRARRRPPRHHRRRHPRRARRAP